MATPTDDFDLPQSIERFVPEAPFHGYAFGEVVKYSGVPFSVALWQCSDKEKSRPWIMPYQRYKRCMEEGRILTMAEFDAYEQTKGPWDRFKDRLLG